jgi:acetylornithine/succinyldiaminopimelate/putrescine aminotransferase
LSILKRAIAREVAAALREKGILVLPTAKSRLRCVAHLDVSFADIDHALKAVEEVMRK